MTVPRSEYELTNGDPAAILERKSIAGKVADTLRNRIVLGEMTPGSRIIERLVCAELNVSRTPVREALKLLEADGIVEISRNRGARVTEYTPNEALELFDVIAVLESLAAERLAASITIDTLADLEELHARMLTFYRAGAIEPYFDTNTQIHDMVIRACGNAALEEAHRRVTARARRGRFLAIMDPARLDQAVEEHQELMAALRSKDSLTAAAVWRTHLLHTGQTLAAVLVERSAG
jgi:DNA-binding GntR family transcriptional regulator